MNKFVKALWLPVVILVPGEILSLVYAPREIGLDLHLIVYFGTLIWAFLRLHDDRNEA